MSAPVTSSDFENLTPGQSLCDAFQEKLLNNANIRSLLDYLFVDPDGTFAPAFITDLYSLLAPVGSYKEFPLEVAADVANPTTGPIYVEANGQELLRATYPRLFAYLGTTFNLPADTDATRFRVPDRSGKFHIARSGSKAQASTGGEETHTLIEAELPEIQLHVTTPTFRIKNSGDTGSGGQNIYTNDTGPVQDPTTEAFGGDGEAEPAAVPHNNMPPYLTGVVYIIAGYNVNSVQI